jgi:4-hydroxy-4-methyl-2-oxoglutarate aldolase
MQDSLTRIARIPTAILSDAMARLGTMSAAIKPVIPRMEMTGIAHTVRCFPGDYLTLLKALAEAREGEVLVVDGGGVAEAALLGKLMAIEAGRKGLRGFVVDGAVRDLRGLVEVKVPVFSRAVTPRVGTAEHVQQTQVPIICGGAPVQPGDVVRGDEDGVVVVPAKRLREVVLRALEITRHETQVVRKLKHGQPLAELMKLFDRLIELRKRG